MDIFRVEGRQRQDYVYHGFTNTCNVLDANFQPASSEKLYDFKNVRAAGGTGIWRASWNCSGRMTCVAWNISQPGERAFIADGWGQRDWKNSAIGATIPYIVRRCEGPVLKTFISIFEGHEGEPFVRAVKLLDPSGALAVQTTLGADYVLSPLDIGTLRIGASYLTGHFAVASAQEGKLVWTFVQERPPSSRPSTAP